MSLDIEIRDLLRSNEVKQINFIMRGIRISGHGYQALSECFSVAPIAHRIRVTVRPQLVPGRATAQYDPVDDKINLRSPDVLRTVFGRSVVVHECTHAQLDLRGVTTSIRSDESAAYIAETWYRLASDDSLVAMRNDGIPTDVINVTISLRERANRARGAAVSVRGDEIDLLRRAMARIGYSAGHYLGNDGIRGQIYRGE